MDEAERDALMKSSIECVTSASVEFSKLNQRIGGPPSVPGSPMDDFARAASKNTGPEGQWPDDIGRRITDRTAIYLTGAQRFLASILALLQHYPNGLGLASLARCVCEASGKTIWLLDNRIGTVTHSRERTARLLFDEADDARRRCRIADGLGHPDRAKHGDEYRRALDASTKPGYFYAGEIAVDKKTRVVSVRTERYPGTSQFVLIAEQVLNDPQRVSKHVYAYLSATTHPTMFAYMESIAVDDPLFYARVANYAVGSFYNGMRVFCSWILVDATVVPERDELFESLQRLGTVLERHS